MKDLLSEYQQLLATASLHQAKNKNILKQFSKSGNKDALGEYTKNAFEKIDCLSCANCCKTLGPILEQADFIPISNALKISVSQLLMDYIVMDEDGDFTFKSLPCPFLQDDLYCSIYDSRPRSCREFPHTDDLNFKKLNDMHIKNSLTCPAVQKVIDQIEVELNTKC